MTITFTGDTSITGSFIDKIQNNKEIFSQNILQELDSNNFVICNLEGAVTDIKLSENEKITINSPSNTIKYLTKRNINTFNLANNHILDSGSRGLDDTLINLQKNNCKYFGAGNSLSQASQACILEHENIKIALFGFSDSNTKILSEKAVVFSSKQISELKKQITNIRKYVDYIILNFHGGEEYTNLPSPTKRRFLKKISKIKGIDIIIAHHSHTLQSYEKYKGKYIFYSLGNFIFDIELHNLYPYTKESALLKFDFTKKDFSFNFIPFRIENGKILTSEYSKFQEYFNKISDFSQYKKKWRAEAFRVLFRDKDNQNTEISKNDNSLQKKSVFKLFLSLKFYKKAINILFSNNYRALYISAIVHKIYLKF